MRARKFYLGFLCLFAIAAASALPATEKPDLLRVTPVPADQPIPVADFFRSSLLQPPTLNRAGTHVAAVVSDGEDRHKLLVYELKTKKIEIVRASDDRDMSQVDWLDDRRLVFQLVARKMYGVGLMAADVGSLQRAYPLFQYYGTSVVAVPPGDRLHPLVWNRGDALDQSAQHDLGVASVDTDRNDDQLVNLLVASAGMNQVAYARQHNERHILKSYPGPKSGITVRYIANSEGQLEFCETALEGKFSLEQLVGDHWQKCPVDLDKIDILDHGNRPGQLVVRGPREEGKPRPIRFMDGASGKLGEILLQDDAYDFYEGWLYREPVKHHIVGAMYSRSGPEAVWFNPGYRELQKLLDGYFPGLVVRIIGSDEAQKIFLVATYSDRQPVVYNWVDLEKRSYGLIERSEPWIDPTRMQPMNILEFTTRDGRRLDAYLTLPAGATKSNPPPLVVLCHGGPWSRDSWGFNGEVQFLASRGYAVLQTNYRGSDGVSWMFPEDDKWDFAKMHNDVTDATKGVLASGLVDRDRVAIMGGSFGGYLAVSGVVNEPTLYRCAVTIAGVFDWERQIKDDKYEQYDSPRYGYMMRKLGDPSQQRAKFEAISPGRHVDRIQVPVFVAGGKEDQTVVIQQSQNLLSAMDKYHVPHESYITAEEGHGMRHIGKQVELYTRIEAFLEKNLARRKSPVAAAGSP